MYDVIIIGSGPAGLTAAIYTTRANLKTLVIAGAKWGGQLMLTTLVENYPGFPDGIQGPDLMMAMRKQAEKHGAEFVDTDFTRLQVPSAIADQPASTSEASLAGGGQAQRDFSKPPFKVTAGEKTFEGRSIIIATGAETKWLDVPGEKEKVGHGVSSCAPCDGAFFRDKNVIVVGGGDAAMEEALFLTKFAKSITVVHRREELRASKIMQDRALAHPKIQFLFNTTIEEIMGDQKVEKVKLKSPFSVIQNLFRDLPENRKMLKPFGLAQGGQFQHDNQELVWEMPIDGVFVAIGHIPNSQIFKGIEMDTYGFIKVHNHFRTNVEGVFVAGDVHDAEYKQAITAAGFGCAAALEAERWLSKQSS